MAIKENLRVAFIHGRPRGHPIHAYYANSLNADFYYEDRYLRWLDNPGAWKLKRYVSWIINAFFFPKRKKYDIFLTECIRIPQLLMKKFNLIKSRQKLVALMADESLYFLNHNKYPWRAALIMRQFLINSDAIICIGDFQTCLAKKILPIRHQKKIYTIFNGIPLKSYEPVISRTENKILFIGNIESEWRLWYKGLDLMIRAFSTAHKHNKSLKFLILGVVKTSDTENLVKNLDYTTKKSISFIGAVKNVEPYIKSSSLYLHCSRGDAFPTTVLESMNLGLPALISCDTGTQEIVSQVSKKLIVELDQESIARQINWYFNLSKSQKAELAMKSTQVMANYDQKKALARFKEVFNEISQRGL